MLPHAVHGGSDVQEMFEELQRHIFVNGVVERQFQGHFEHILAIQGHPGGTVCLLELGAAGQRFTAVEHPDVVQPEKAPLEYIAVLRVFAVDPPGKVERELLEGVL